MPRSVSETERRKTGRQSPRGGGSSAISPSTLRFFLSWPALGGGGLLKPNFSRPPVLIGSFIDTARRNRAGLCGSAESEDEVRIGALRKDMDWRGLMPRPRLSESSISSSSSSPSSPCLSSMRRFSLHPRFLRFHTDLLCCVGLCL